MITDFSKWPKIKNLRGKLATFVENGREISYIVDALCVSPKGVLHTYNGATVSPISDTVYENLKMKGVTFKSNQYVKLHILNTTADGVEYTSKGVTYKQSHFHMRRMLIEDGYTPVK